MEFEWGEEKRAKNLADHGVDFVRVALMFANPTIEDVDDREDYGEERIIALGHVDGAVYRVVYTLRADVIRLISAQKAHRRDQKRYFAEVSG